MDGLPKKAWPHAPLHRMDGRGIYMVTAATLYKRPLFNTPEALDLLEELLLGMSKRSGWALEAWALFANHYHFIARNEADTVPLSRWIRELHSRSAVALNKLAETPGRRVWYNFWDTMLTYERSYLARLNYVHRNAVKHGLVAVANQYRWCSAAWFEQTASPAQVKTVYSFKTDRVNVIDDF